MNATDSAFDRVGEATRAFDRVGESTRAFDRVANPPTTDHLAAELRGILDDLHDAEHGAVPKHLVRERLLRLTEHVEALGAETETTVTGEVDLTAAGLDPEQEIRARAALAARPPFGVRSQIEVAEEIAAYIRDGSRPT